MQIRQPGKETGVRAEDIARRHLEQRGLKTRTKNYRCRLGEIDLIMEEGNTLVFVEVRYRRSTDFGSAAESVNRLKQRKLIKTAEHYLNNSALPEPPCRFDVLAISGRNLENVIWIKDAFQQTF